MDGSYEKQLIQLGAILASRRQIDAKNFEHTGLRQVVQGLQEKHPDVSSLKRFLRSLGVEWNGAGKVLDAIEEEMVVDAEYERSMRAAKSVFKWWLRPKGTKQEVIEHVRKILTPEQLRIYDL